MRYFDHDYAQDLLDRLRKIDADARPAWGKLTPSRMVYHLDDTFRYSMGRGVPDFYAGSFLSRYVFGPLILNGIVPIPKNVPLRVKLGDPRDSTMPEAIAVLEETVHDYLSAVEQGAMEPCQHPGFGPIGIDGWAKMHVLHCDHHCRQFGV